MSIHEKYMVNVELVNDGGEEKNLDLLRFHYLFEDIC